MVKISKEQLARNLEEKVHPATGGADGLETLIYGWLRYRKYGKKYRHAVHARKFLYITEVHDLSNYAGYDLSA